MNDCRQCGQPVRLGAVRVTINRKRGVEHYVAHRDGSPMHGGSWVTVAFKPYPVRQEDKPWCQMLARWDAENPPV